MKFKPFTKNYDFTGEALLETYPSYLIDPVKSWLRDAFESEDIFYRYEDWGSRSALREEFVNEVNVLFREEFPRSPEDFLEYVLSSSERTTEMLNFCLQNYASPSQIARLDLMLAKGGSAYSAMCTRANPQGYEKGIGQIVHRVPEIVLLGAQEALSSESMLREAWGACYARNPDFDKVVSKCCDVLEKTWNKYFPNDSKPQIKKFVHGLKVNPALLTYRGDTLVQPKSLLSDIAERFSDVRGQHSSGTGRSPSKEEAELVLHYTIFIWNLENQS